MLQGLVRTGKMRVEKERLQKKNPKNTASSKSEESNSEEFYEDLDSKETRSEELVQTNRRPKPNPAQEEKRSKKMHKSKALEGSSEKGPVYGLRQSEDHTLAETIRRIRKRKNQEKEERNNKKKKQPNENSLMGSANVDNSELNPLNNTLSKKKKLLLNNLNNKKKLLLNNLNKNHCNNLSRLIRMKSLISLQARTMSIYQAPSRSGIHWSLKLKKINHPIKKINLLTLQEMRLLPAESPAELEWDVTGGFRGELPADLAFRGSGPKKLPTDYISAGKSHSNNWRSKGKMGGKFFRRNPNREPPSEPPNPHRRYSPSSLRPNLPSPPVVFSVTGSRGEGSLEYDQDPHLGNGAVDPTLAVRVSWCRCGDVAAATTTVEPVYSLPPTTVGVFGPRRLEPPPNFLAGPSSGPVTPSHPVCNFNHCSPLKAQGTVLTGFDAAQRFVPASLLHHCHSNVQLLNQNIQDMARQLHESEERIQALHDELSRRPEVHDADVEALKEQLREELRLMQEHRRQMGVTGENKMRAGSSSAAQVSPLHPPALLEDDDADYVDP
ncbi:hypothetical protein PIB30_060876 [Stylosanthes scabra]|uniref:Uncharacterized protein n=1 Tax=Stylosanthes scabra TaxID=79078 RepID=A0ABU6ZJC8_9FABA|nr:hypothetical protein [Stylosanthes scabra]